MIVATRPTKGNDKLVLSFCYPTAKSLTQVDYLSKNHGKRRIVHAHLPIQVPGQRQ